MISKEIFKKFNFICSLQIFLYSILLIFKNNRNLIDIGMRTFIFYQNVIKVLDPVRQNYRAKSYWN